MNWCPQIKTVLEIESLEQTWAGPRDQMFYSTERDCTHWVSDVTVPNGVTSCNILYKYQSMANEDYFYLKGRFTAFGSLLSSTQYIMNLCNVCERSQQTHLGQIYYWEDNCDGTSARNNLSVFI